MATSFAGSVSVLKTSTVRRAAVRARAASARMAPYFPGSPAPEHLDGRCEALQPGATAASPSQLQPGL